MRNYAVPEEEKAKFQRAFLLRLFALVVYSFSVIALLMWVEETFRVGIHLFLIMTSLLIIVGFSTFIYSLDRLSKKFAKEGYEYSEFPLLGISVESFLKMILGAFTLFFIPSYLIINFSPREITTILVVAYSIVPLQAMVIYILRHKVVKSLPKEAHMLDDEELTCFIHSLVDKSKFPDLSGHVLVTRKETLFPNAVIYNSPGSKLVDICLSKNLFEMLNREEQKAIIAHEVGHLLRRDTLRAFFTSISLYGVFGIAMILPDRFGFSLSPEIRTAITIFFVLSSTLWMTYGMREREFKADLYAARKVGRESCISALLKLGDAHPIPKKPHPFFRILGTHPSIDDRIKRLRETL